MFDAFSTRLQGVLGRLRSRGRLSDEDVDDALREIRGALLEADVEVGVVRSFVEGTRARLVGGDLSRSLSPAQQVVKAVNDELVRILGGETLRISFAPSPPTVVLLVGLQGSGKTTTAAKMARWFRQQGRNPMLVGADLQRPAAVAQLRILGEQVGVPVFSEPSDPVTVATAGVHEARRLGRDVVVVDTAGRLTVDRDLMDEVRRVSAAITPHYAFLVIDAMTGQDAVATAQAFHETLDLHGVVLTKLDSDARGGAALSVKEVVGRPIAFASTGERLGDFDQFHPDRMASRILGMGDVLSLVEQAEREFDREVAERGAAALLQGRFTLEDFLAQLQQVKKLGSLGGILSLLPGVPKELKQAPSAMDDRQVAQVEAIIRSMTPAERVDPALVDGSRRQRIARGSGTATQEVNQLLRQFKQAQALVRSPGMLGGLFGAGRGTAKRADAMGSLGAGPGNTLDLAGIPGLGDTYGDTFGDTSGDTYGAGSGTSSPVGAAGGKGPTASSKKNANKKKKGGRVTPRSGRPGRPR